MAILTNGDQASGYSTVVKHLTTDLKIAGSNPTAVLREKKETEERLMFDQGISKV